MTTNDTRQNQLPGRVLFLDGQGELPLIEVTTATSIAEIYLQGAQITSFKKHGEPPLLFMSQCSRFIEGRPIRGGIPIIFPWFGPREGMAQHGFARNKRWELKAFEPAADGSVTVRLCLPESPEAASFPPFTADYVVTVSETLQAQLVVTNRSTEDVLTFENCLHTYFEVSDVSAIHLTGLKGVDYLDQVAHYARRTESEEAIRIAAEVDRIYLDSPHAVEIHDPGFRRIIRVDKTGSASTVVWNPWIAKAQQMPDFANDEYRRMVCVESGNVASNQLSLAPGQSSTLSVSLSQRPT